MPWCGGTPQQNVGELTNRTLTEPKYIDRLRPLLSAASEVTAAIGLDADVGHLHLALSLFSRLEAFNRRIPAPAQCQIDPLRDPDPRPTIGIVFTLRHVAVFPLDGGRIFLRVSTDKIRYRAVRCALQRAAGSRRQDQAKQLFGQ